MARHNQEKKVKDRCCICSRSVEDDRVLLIKFGPRGPRACVEHLREAVERSDSWHPTDEEWIDIGKRMEHSLLDVLAEGASSNQGVQRD